MTGLRSRTVILWIIFLAGLVAVAGVSALLGIVGIGFAYLSLVFGVLFFAFAARYYVATIAVLISPSASPTNGSVADQGAVVKEKAPKVSVHIALYNEERVVERLLDACSKLDYSNYEVVVVDDSNDGTVGVLKDLIMKQMTEKKPKFKIIHRDNREGFKGGALNEALKKMDPKAEYVVVFDADFVPQPDILTRFLAYFSQHGPNGNGNGVNGRSGRYGNGKLAAVQGYQWHTLNRTENWLTRGVSCEFSGNYMVDRTFQEVMGTMKMVAGSVYMIRADLLREYRWSGSLTEDWEITLRLYSDGYRVLFTPLIQAPAECPSNLAKLVRQRMRWAEGHTYNVKKYFLKVMLSPKVGIREKLEFLYFAPYYLQSVFLILGTAFWLSSDVLLATKLPFWTATVGWGLVFTNLLALPVMSLTGLFLEKRTRKDFPGLLSQLLLVYALSPYQGYAALKGLVEPVEGSWVRTFKSGKLAGFPGRLEPRKVIKEMLPPRRASRPVPAGATMNVTLIVVVGISALLGTAATIGQFMPQGSAPAYYFYNQGAPPSYSPFGPTSGTSFLMHIPPPNGQDTRVPIGALQGSEPVFFSDTAPGDIVLPFGASVSIHIWVDAGSTAGGDPGTGAAPSGRSQTNTSSTTAQTTESTTSIGSCGDTGDVQGSNGSPLWQTKTTMTCTTSQTTQTAVSQVGCEACGNLKFRIDFYNPANNTISQIPGVGETEVFHLEPGVNFYEASWGNIAQNKDLQMGETLVVSIWCPDCKASPVLLFNSQPHPSNIDFPIVVPENAAVLAGVAVSVPVMAGLAMNLKRSRHLNFETLEEEGRMRGVQRTLIIAGAIIFLTLPLLITFNDFLTSAVMATHLDKYMNALVPYEAGAASGLLRGLGLQAGNSATNVWLSGAFIPVTAFIDWNCSGWQSFLVFGMTSVSGLKQLARRRDAALVAGVGLLGVFAVNVLRITSVVMLGYYVGYPAALLFHDYGGTLLTLAWLLGFWTFALGRYGKNE